MKPSMRDLLLDADIGANGDLDLLRRLVLDREVPTSRRPITWTLIAASWLLIAILKALTPAPPPTDPASAKLDRAARELGKEIASISPPSSEP